PGFTITESKPSCVPRQTSISAPYFEIAYTLFFSSGFHWVCSVINSLFGVLPKVATELTEQSFLMFFERLRFTIFAVPSIFIFFRILNFPGSKEMNAAQWYTWVTFSKA